MKKLLCFLFLLLLIPAALHASDFTVSGATSPTECNGDYTYGGITQGYPYYKHNSQNYFISNVGWGWVISDAADAVIMGTNWYFCWESGTAPAGSYDNPGGPFYGTGNVTVTVAAGGGPPPPTPGQVIMISDDGEGAPSYGYNYDFISVYPSTQTDTCVKATSSLPGYCLPYYATDPTKSLTGIAPPNTWVSEEHVGTNQRFHIDLGSAKTVKRIYYENYMVDGVYSGLGVKNFQFFGSNTAGDFSDLVYADTGNWVELTCSQNTFDQHVEADIVDPKYITITNTIAYRYYGFKFADAWSGTEGMGVRRIELQTAR